MVHLPATQGTLHVSPQPPQLFESVCSLTQTPSHEVCPGYEGTTGPASEPLAEELVPLHAPASKPPVVPPVEPLTIPVLPVLPLAVPEPFPMAAIPLDVPATEALPEAPAVVPVAVPKTEPGVAPELPPLPVPALAPSSRPPHASDMLAASRSTVHSWAQAMRSVERIVIGSCSRRWPRRHPGRCRRCQPVRCTQPSV